MKVSKFIEMLTAIAKQDPEANVELATYNLADGIYGGDIYRLEGVALKDCDGTVIKLIFEHEEPERQINKPARITSMRLANGGTINE